MVTLEVTPTGSCTVVFAFSIVFSQELLFLPSLIGTSYRRQLIFAKCHLAKQRICSISEINPTMTTCYLLVVPDNNHLLGFSPTDNKRHMLASLYVIYQTQVLYIPYRDSLTVPEYIIERLG